MMQYFLNHQLLQSIRVSLSSRILPKKWIALVLSFVTLIAIVFLNLQAWGSSTENIQNPKDSNQWVLDAAKVWPPKTEMKLEKMLSDLERRNKIEFVIVTVPNILAGTNLHPVAKTLRQKFHVGKSKFDNGLLLLISKRPEKLIGVISMGSGIPTNYFQKDVIDANQILTIEQWLPSIISDLGIVSYQSQPVFKPIYQLVGWIGLGLSVGGAIVFEYFRCLITKSNHRQQELTASITQNYLNSAMRVSIVLIRVGIALSVISPD
jgi:TPM domain